MTEPFVALGCLCDARCVDVGSSVADELTAIARGRLKPAFCSENESDYVRYFLKFKIGAGKDNTWLAGEDNASHC